VSWNLTYKAWDVFFILEILPKKMETYHYPFVIMYFEFEKVSLNFATYTSLLKLARETIL